MILTEYCDSCYENFPVTLMRGEQGINGPGTGDGLWCGYCIEDYGYHFEWPGEEKETAMNSDHTLTMIEDLQGILKSRERQLEAVREEILAHAQATMRLEMRAAKWEQGIAAVEGQIEDLLGELDQPPLDMAPTGEGEDETDEDWEAAGFTVA